MTNLYYFRMLRRSLVIVLFVSAVMNAPLYGQEHSVLFGIRGFSNQALTYLNLTTGEVRDSVAAIGPSANEIKVYNDVLYVINSGQFPGASNASIKYGRMTDFLAGTQPTSLLRIADGINPYNSAPFAFLRDNTGVSLAVTNYLDSSISFYQLRLGNRALAQRDTIQFLNTASIGRQGPQGIVSTRSRLYVMTAFDPATFAYDSTISVFRVSGETPALDFVRRIQVDLNPQSATLDHRNVLHVVCTGNFNNVFGVINVVDPQSDSVIAKIPTTGSPSAVVHYRDGIMMYSGGFLNNRLFRYDANFNEIPTRFIQGGSLAILGDTLFIGRSGRITLYDAQTLDSLTQYDLRAGQSYSSLLPLRLSPSVLSVPKKHTERPLDFALNQNYPNPFNPSTTIRYSLPVSGMIRLEVFDILGRKVATLINGLTQAGTNEVSFDAGKFGLSSGVYFYRLQSGEKVFTRKMVLSK